jgi:hypothetical protein
MGLGLRVFIIECPNPQDLLKERSEIHTLEKANKLLGHEVATFLVKSRGELETTCQYISTLHMQYSRRGRRPNEPPLVVHISSHGTDEGLAFGKDLVSWDDIFKTVRPIYKEMPSYNGEKILIISACGAGNQTLTQTFTKKARYFDPPDHVFATGQGDVGWSEAVVSWTILYHQLPLTELLHERIRKVLDSIRELNLGTIYYYRWIDGQQRYINYP